MSHLAQFTVINELRTMSVNECTEAQSILPTDREKDRKRNVIYDAVAQCSVARSVLIFSHHSLCFSLMLNSCLLT